MGRTCLSALSERLVEITFYLSRPFGKANSDLQNHPVI